MRSFAAACLLQCLAASAVVLTAPAAALGAPTSPAVAAAPASPAAASDLDRLMQRLAQRKHGHVSFVEEHFISMLDRPLESSGELLYDAPDRLEKRTLKPKPETLVLEHGVLIARRGHRTYTLELRNYPQVVPLIDSVRATLAGDRAALERIFKVDFAGTLEHWKLVLVPSDPTIARTVKLIRIDGARADIGSVEILQADGDRSVLTLGPEIAGSDTQPAAAEPDPAHANTDPNTGQVPADRSPGPGR